MIEIVDVNTGILAQAGLDWNQVASFPVPEGGSCFTAVNVIAIAEGSLASKTFRVQGLAKRDLGGVASLLDTRKDVLQEAAAAGWDFRIQPLGDDAMEYQARGDIATKTFWHVRGETVCVTPSFQ